MLAIYIFLAAASVLAAIFIATSIFPNLPGSNFRPTVFVFAFSTMPALAMWAYGVPDWVSSGWVCSDILEVVTFGYLGDGLEGLESLNSFQQAWVSWAFFVGSAVFASASLAAAASLIVGAGICVANVCRSRHFDLPQKLPGERSQ